MYGTDLKAYNKHGYAILIPYVVECSHSHFNHVYIWMYIGAYRYLCNKNLAAVYENFPHTYPKIPSSFLKN